MRHMRVSIRLSHMNRATEIIIAEFGLRKKCLKLLINLVLEKIAREIINKE